MEFYLSVSLTWGNQQPPETPQANDLACPCLSPRRIRTRKANVVLLRKKEDILVGVEWGCSERGTPWCGLPSGLWELETEIGLCGCGQPPVIAAIFLDFDREIT